MFVKHGHFVKHLQRSTRLTKLASTGIQLVYYCSLCVNLFIYTYGFFNNLLKFIFATSPEDISSTTTDNNWKRTLYNLPLSGIF